MEAQTRQVKCKEAARPKKKLANQGKGSAGTVGIDFDDNFAFIAGFTSGGAPFGTTWEEARVSKRVPFELAIASDQDGGEYDPFAKSLE